MVSVVPVAKALSLCDYHVGYSDGKVDLYGLFNAIRPQAGYPFTRGRFCVFRDRTTVVQLALSIEECAFESPGLYTMELFCDNTWVCDTQLLLR
jgi:hypothetical protein